VVVSWVISTSLDERSYNIIWTTVRLALNGSPQKREPMAAERGPTARKTRAPGNLARARILEHSARLATIEGLEGLSIGRLAEATGVAKSSVHALFGSKEELQLATINAARENFITEVVGPALAATSPGRKRLLALCEGYLSYVERRVFPGGCFFVAASAEVGAQPGRVHDEVARVQQQWRDLLLQEAHAAVDKGELTAACEPAQLAFELGVILAGTDIVAILHDDAGAVSRGRAAVATRLKGSPI
jgi:AcrR family transcriptional regulator